MTMDKDTEVKREISRLTNLYKDVDRERRLTAKNLIEEAAYMKATLKELKQSIDEHGPIDDMPQGKYSILREHPALKSYNTMVQRYSGIIKQLMDLLPKAQQKKWMMVLTTSLTKNNPIDVYWGWMNENRIKVSTKIFKTYRHIIGF